MMNRMVNKEFAQEIAAVIRTAQNGDRLPELLKHYHQRDVAKAVTLLTDAERERLFRQLDAQTLAEIFPYLDDASRFLAELPADLAAEMIADMDTADALDMLRELPGGEETDPGRPSGRRHPEGCPAAAGLSSGGDRQPHERQFRLHPGHTDRLRRHERAGAAGR